METIFPDSTVIAVRNFILGHSKNTAHRQEVPIMKSQSCLIMQTCRFNSVGLFHSIPWVEPIPTASAFPDCMFTEMTLSLELRQWPETSSLIPTKRN